MRTYLITYDINKPNEQFRERVLKAVKNFPNWARLSESSYAVAYDGDASSAWDFIAQFMDTNDRLFVIRLGPDWKGYGPKQVTEWLVNFLGGTDSGLS